MDVEVKSTSERAIEAGIDVSLIDANLRLSVTERFRQHDVALNRMLKMRAAVKKWNERTD